jgi:hypothetical protein
MSAQPSMAGLSAQDLRKPTSPRSRRKSNIDELLHPTRLVPMLHNLLPAYH